MSMVLAISFALVMAMSHEQAASIAVSRSDTRTPYPSPAERFTGAVHMLPFFDAKEPARTAGASVTFESKADRGDGHSGRDRRNGRLEVLGPAGFMVGHALVVDGGQTIA